MDKGNKIIYSLLYFLFFCGSFFAFDNFIFANNVEVDHIVISEILVTGSPSTYDFIELYNPTNVAINLNGHRLVKRTADATTDTLIKSWTSDTFIPAYSFYLWANSSYDINPVADVTTTQSIANNNGIALRYGANNVGVIIDSVVWGEVASDHAFKKSEMIANPLKGQSLERDGSSFKTQDSPNPQNSSDSGDGQGGSSQETEANDEEQDSESSEDPESDLNQDTESDSGNAQDGSIVLRDNVANNVIITEFLPNPEDSDRDNEFIEIYNDDDVEVDLSGWILEDKMGSVKKFVIPDGTKISAGKYKVFYSDETRIALNNSGDGVVLKDNENNIIDETEISDSALEERAFALDENGNWVWTMRTTPGMKNVIEIEEVIVKDKSDFTQKGSSQETGANDVQDGSTALRDYGANDDFDFSDKIIISEIYPNSEGRDNRNGSYEWIEIYNDSDRDVNLNGWMIDDILEKGSKPYLIENEIIGAKSYKIFDAACTKIALNNTGDEVNILWPDGIVVDKIKYEKADEGLSYNLSKNGDWFWSSVITPEEENRNFNFSGNNIVEYDTEYLSYLEDEYFVDEEFENGFGGKENAEPDYVEVDLKDINHFTKYTRIKTSGIVSTPPGIFSDKVFYISGSGIQIYSYENEIQNLNIGDEVEIIGKISEVGGEKRILLDKNEDIKIISSDNLVESKIVSTGDINEMVEGYLITVEGKVSRIKNDVFFLNDGSGEVKIYIKSQTGIKKPKIKIGDWMVITGQVSQTSAGYRILPRFQGDIRLSKVTGVAQAADVANNQENVENDEEENKTENKNSSFVFYGIMMIVGILILVDWVKIRIVRDRKIK